MSERQTKKLTEAQRLARSLGWDNMTREQLYDTLMKAGYNWDGKSKTWSENNKWQGSAFEDAYGTATGHVKLRVMAHPDDMPDVIGKLRRGLVGQGIDITEVSEPYENRKGVGVRVYITGEMRS